MVPFRDTWPRPLASFKISGAMSAEPGKRCAYGADIRWRIVYQRIGMNLGYEKIARNLRKSSAPCLVPEMYPGMQLIGTTPPKEN